jgi:hypothetical protein
MNDEEFEKRPYRTLDWFDYKSGPRLSDGWDYPRCATTLLAEPGRPIPLPVGPGTFVLPFLLEDFIKTIEVKYQFEAGHD